MNKNDIQRAALLAIESEQLTDKFTGTMMVKFTFYGGGIRETRVITERVLMLTEKAREKEKKENS